jgi:rRNA-processing protein FCF1
MKDVLLDTNFLLLPHTHHLDVFSELERVIPEEHRLLVLSGTLKELTVLSSGGSESAVAARVALALLERKKVEVLESEGNVDEALLSYSQEHKNAVVCTNDRNLKKKLKEKRTPIISLRGSDTLVMA